MLIGFAWQKKTVKFHRGNIYQSIIPIYKQGLPRVGRSTVIYNAIFNGLLNEISDETLLKFALNTKITEKEKDFFKKIIVEENESIIKLPLGKGL